LPVGGGLLPGGSFLLALLLLAALFEALVCRSLLLVRSVLGAVKKIKIMSFGLSIWNRIRIADLKKNVSDSGSAADLEWIPVRAWVSLFASKREKDPVLFVFRINKIESGKGQYFILGFPLEFPYSLCRRKNLCLFIFRINKSELIFPGF
jgi:hypothetical protein